jgi:AraC-like DNA-binding protein
MQTISFDSADLPGNERLRRERWVDSLSSGYVRLRADAGRNVPFNGQLKIMLLGETAIGRISGTVQTITRGATEIAIENTDNAVLLLNSGTDDMLVEQNDKSVACTAGAAVLIEQCVPSSIQVGAHHLCDFMAIQLPRQQLHGHMCNVADRFMTPIPAAASALTLAYAYVDTLLKQSGAERADIPRFAAGHIVDLVAAAVALKTLRQETQAPSLRAARFETVRRELDRSFMMPGFSLSALARRLPVSPRYVQALFSEAGTSFTDELTNRRLTRAYEMLASPRYAHMNVVDVAHECGFATVSHFHRMFRRRFDATPGEVRDRAAR